jgi:hypothetical protein
MPTLLLENGYRFFFYSNENNEPIHVHVIKADTECKVWLEPVISVAYSLGLSTKEIKNVLEIVEKNSDNFKLKWYEYFNK